MASECNVFKEQNKVQYGWKTPRSLSADITNNGYFVQKLKLHTKLPVHEGCVNTICWNDTGQYILSGSDDQFLNITDPFSKKRLTSIRSGHRSNIFSAKFMPQSNDTKVVSCSGDGVIFYTDIEREDSWGSNSFNCHYGTTYELLTLPNDPHTFLSCGEDGAVRWYDLRLKTSCRKEKCKEDILIHNKRAVSALAVDPVVPYHLAVGCADSTVKIFDRRMLGTRLTGSYNGKGVTGMMSCFCPLSAEGRTHRLTSLQYSVDGREVLASYSSEYLYLFEVKEEAKKEKIFHLGSTHKEKAPSEPQGAFSEPLVAAATAPLEAVSKLTSIPEDDTPSTSSDNSVGRSTPRHPPVKRLRLRGDWSDTGPQARPESERNETESPHVTIMRRMSDMLVRLLDPARQDSEEGQRQADGATTMEGQQQQQADGATTMERQQQQQQADGATTVEGQQQQAEGATTVEGEQQTESQGTEASSSLPLPSSHNQSERQEEIQCSENEISESSAMQETDLGQTPQVPPTECPQGSVICQGAEGGASTPEVEGATGVPSAPLNRSSETMLEKIDRMQNEITFLKQTLRDRRENPVVNLHYSAEGVDAGRVEMNFSLPQIRTGVELEDIHQGQSAINESQSQPEGSVDFPVEGNGHLVGVRVSTGERNQESEMHESQRDNEPGAVQSQTDTLTVLEQQAADLADAKKMLLERDSKDQTVQREDAIKLTESGRPSASAGGTASVCEKETDSSASVCDTVVTHVLTDPNTDHKSENEKESPSLSTETPVVEHNSGSLAPDTLKSGGNTAALKSKSDEVLPSVRIVCENQEQENSAEAEQSGQTESSVSDTAGTSGQMERAESTSAETLEHSVSQASTSRAEEATSSSSSGRRTRRGFQLFGETSSEEEDTSSSEEEDVHAIMRLRSEARRLHRRTSSDAQLERNVAAMKLQEVFRKRQKEKAEKAELAKVYNPPVKKVYKGHRNARTMIKEAKFWGENHVMSGSDCGHIFIWDRHSTELVMMLEADRHVVNCLQPHPFDPILASSGIDYDIKLWYPCNNEPDFQRVKAEEVVARNDVMLEETRDTVTVPASFMLRMLASLNHIRQGRRNRREREGDDVQETRDSSSDED